MSQDSTLQLAGLIKGNEAALVDELITAMRNKLMRFDKVSESEIRQQTAQLLKLLELNIPKTTIHNLNDSIWAETKQLLTEFSHARVKQGYTPAETASIIFSLKEPIFKLLRAALTDQPQQLVEELATTTALFDNLGLYTIDVFQKARELVISRQQQELLELSTPVVQLWQNVLALPLIGTLDSARTQVVMENLLQKIVETGALIAIIDITGVPTVDTLVAQHLLKTIAAARLMGADCIISGIRPQIAQTIVHLGVNLEDVITKATLADAFVIALKKTGASITNSAA
ncbi:STAS domain-containing protein [Methylophilus sp. Leaf414]|jgi:rsbT co-antagonist protein RsbR|uniref:STAS domain-containing protein n=1 Tax=Methylophilus sp. Leaf414 TaxID=1736371 RepID=UPI0006F8EE75|nr:STAS domain-containing protein [Methylophilus sp. Leaf414]KQT36073.1 anti-anti-sigma factor [Methylophilus sp. Leaf414]